MKEITKVAPLAAELLRKVIIDGDLSNLTDQELLLYNRQVCELLELNELTRPLQYLTLKGKKVLYVKKEATDELRKNHKISIYNIETKIINDLYIVISYGRTPDGREDASTAVINIKSLFGEDLANAMMKCETKSKRRLTLSMSGLGFLDESEVESMQAPPVNAAVERLDALVAPDISKEVWQCFQGCQNLEKLKEIYEYLQDIYPTQKRLIAKYKDERKNEIENKEFIRDMTEENLNA